MPFFSCPTSYSLQHAHALRYAILQNCWAHSVRTGFIPNSVGRGGRAPIFEQVGAIPADLIVLDILLAAADNGANSA